MLDFLYQLSSIPAFLLFLAENLLIVICVVIIGYWIQKRSNAKIKLKLTKKELIITIISTLINTGITFLGCWLWKKKIIEFTEEISFSILLDFLILLFAMDIVMYVLHFLIHLSALYKLIHGLHHEYKEPTPVDLFVLSPLEAFSFGSLWLVLIFFYSANIYSVVIYLIVNVLFGMLGHLSVEPFPKKWLSIPIINLICTPTFHYIHHQEKEYNFGFYTTVWDKLFGTLAPHYKDAFLKSKEGT